MKLAYVQVQQLGRKLTEAEQQLLLAEGRAANDSDLRARIRELTDHWREAKCGRCPHPF